MVTEAVPEEARDLTKGAIEGLLGFVDSEVVPLEEKFKDIMD